MDFIRKGFAVGDKALGGIFHVDRNIVGVQGIDDAGLFMRPGIMHILLRTFQQRAGPVAIRPLQINAVFAGRFTPAADLLIAGIIG